MIGTTDPGAALVVATPYGRRGGSSRVRVFDWLDHLGVEADVHDYAGSASNRPRELLGHPVRTLGAELGTRLIASGSAPLLISREASPFSRGHLEQRLFRAARYGVYDVDDALFHDTGSGLRRLFRKDRTWQRAVAAADQVIAGNEYLADRASELATSVTVIPSCIEPSAYQPKSSWALGAVPHIVWLGSPSTESYLHAIAPSLLEVHRRTRARLTVISAGQRPLGALDPFVDRVEWGPDTVAPVLAAGDVAIGPLDDTPYARGKCAYKLLQYAATGLPMVASPVGANASVLHHVGGLAATGEDEWTDALTFLLGADTGHRSRMGAQAMTQVADRYSFRAWAHAWTQAVQL